MVRAASSAAGSSQTNSNENPYEQILYVGGGQVLGVSPVEGFDMVKAAYTRKRKDAEKRGDEAYAAQLEQAYDKIMMSQLSNRKKGLTFGSFELSLTAYLMQVSKDIKYADKQPIVPWGPRFTKSSEEDIRINLAITAILTIWIVVQRTAAWRPMQFLGFVFVYRIFEKLKAFEPQVSSTVTEDGQDGGWTFRTGKRLIRSLALVFGCIAVCSLAFTGILNLIELLGMYIPASLYNSQELFITVSSAIMLFVMASYFR
ncbi:hypothetical protein ACLOJK_009635 [Asimina triloba]